MCASRVTTMINLFLVVTTKKYTPFVEGQVLGASRDT